MRYGENKERTTTGSGIWHWGVLCYSSTDLYNWDDRGLIIPPDVDDPESPLHPAQHMDRPHIVYNAATGVVIDATGNAEVFAEALRIVGIGLGRSS